MLGVNSEVLGDSHMWKSDDDAIPGNHVEFVKERPRGMTQCRTELAIWKSNEDSCLPISMFAYRVYRSSIVAQLKQSHHC